MALAQYKEAHPLPMVITHYINLICMILLICSGILIHYPFIAGTMGVCRGLHIFCGIVLVINCIVRIIFAFTIKTAPAEGTRQTETDIKSWLPGDDNRHQFIQWIKFYLFMRKDHPLGAKYNPLQKLSYILVAVLILAMGYTGLCLWSTTANIGIFAAGTAAVGGAMSMRIIHYFGMFVFIIFMIIHVYLAVSEGGIPVVKMMFSHKEHGGLTYDIHTHALSGEDHSIK